MSSQVMSPEWTTLSLVDIAGAPASPPRERPAHQDEVLDEPASGKRAPTDEPASGKRAPSAPRAGAAPGAAAAEGAAAEKAAAPAPADSAQLHPAEMGPTRDHARQEAAACDAAAQDTCTPDACTPDTATPDAFTPDTFTTAAAAERARTGQTLEPLAAPAPADRGDAAAAPPSCKVVEVEAEVGAIDCQTLEPLAATPLCKVVEVEAAPAPADRSDSHYQSTLDAVYVYVVSWSEFPVVPSNPHYPQQGRCSGGGRFHGAAAQVRHYEVAVRVASVRTPPPPECKEHTNFPTRCSGVGRGAWLASSAFFTRFFYFKK